MTKANVLRRILPIAALTLLSTGVFGKGTIVIDSYLKTNYAIITARYDLSEAYRVKIFDEEGQLLYSSSQIKAATPFQKVFDLTSLDDGDYTIELTGKNGTSSDVFTIANKELIQSANTKVMEQSDLIFFRVAEDKLYVSHNNFDNKDLSISITDKIGAELYNANLSSETTYSGMFDLKDLPRGNYFVSLVSGTKEYYYEINR
ncbi:MULTISPECIES: hypothetical protein [unclassified Carboxylicivirga]|uniref:hypothetical protein n=1 Tax=Carboxylicivirga TaxID=1628153 RepID=UPI003D34E148